MPIISFLTLNRCTTQIYTHVTRPKNKFGSIAARPNRVRSKRNYCNYGHLLYNIDKLIEQPGKLL